jgi:hypothetical protein
VPVSAVNATRNCNGTSYPIFETVFVLTTPSRDDVTELINTLLIIPSDLTADQGRSICKILNILEI